MTRAGRVGVFAGWLLGAIGLVALLSGVGTDEERRTAIRSCLDASTLDFACYQERYDSLFRARGVDAALSALAKESAKGGILGAACHQLTHVVGRAAGQEYGVRAFGKGNPLCSSGYYHGVSEAVMARIGPAQIVASAETVCAAQRAGRSHSLALYNCVHGMGHGFMGVFRSDIFPSLRGCDALADPWEREQCSSGVFMENLTALGNPTRPSRHLKPNRPLYPCTDVAARYKTQCYLKQTAYAVYLRGDDFAAVFALCAASPDVAFRPACYQGVGGDAAVRSSKVVTGGRAVRETIRRLCLLGPTAAARSNCVMGAVGETVRDLVEGADVARLLCGTFRLNEGGLRAACSRGLVAAKRVFAPRRPGLGNG